MYPVQSSQTPVVPALRRRLQAPLAGVRTAEAYALLRDLAYVFHLTERVRQAITVDEAVLSA
jgi:hypothetical protein